MKSISLALFIVVLTTSASPVFAQEKPRSYLTNAYSQSEIESLIIARESWRPFPRAGETGWGRVPVLVREAHIKAAEAYLGKPWQPLPASVFLEYVRTGNRSNFQDLSFGRRQRLATLVLAEAMENKGRFLDEIVNGVWFISEESYWGVPAHLRLQEAGFGLPDVDEPTVDLFAAETASLMAWTDYLVGERLDSISPLIRERIRSEVDRRILTPNLEREDFWWMGFSGGRVNNWNPWVNSNWLTAVLLLETDEARRNAAIYKIMRSLDLFIDSYPSDGGCDEGPGYWGRAAGSLFDTLELLHMATDGGIDIFDKRLIGEMGKYIYRSYIAGSYFINFADAGARINPHPALVYRYGKQVNDDTMTGFGAFLAHKSGYGKGFISGSFGALNRQLPALFVVEELRNTEPVEPLIQEFWLPDTQVMAVRDQEHSREGFYVAMKGGHNDESHNHNDIGNFILYHNGFPVIIDVGAAAYTAATFSSKRYSIWNMQSAYHNTPTINGVMQEAGREFRARRSEFDTKRRHATFQLEIDEAYPEAAKVKSWVRTLSTRREHDIEVRDRYELDTWLSPSKIHFMTPRSVDTSRRGVIVLESAGLEGLLAPVNVELHYDSERVDVEIEQIDLEDPKLTKGWGPVLYRISLVIKSTELQGEVVVRIKA